MPHLKAEWEKVLNEYPIFSEEYRPRLSRIIQDHYFNREIGEETPDLFFFSVERVLFRKMPVINKMYVQSIREIDPLITMEMLSSGKSANKAKSDSKSTGKTDSVSDNESRSVASNNPQVRLAGNADYASGMSDSRAKATTGAASSEEGVSTSEGDATSETTSRGYSGAPGTLLAEYYDTLVNVDEMVLDILAPCFMQVWNTPQPYNLGGIL